MRRALTNLSALLDDDLTIRDPLLISSRSCGAVPTAAGSPVGDGVRAFGRCVERMFERPARLFENLWSGLCRHADRVTNNDYAAAEGKVDGRAVPAVEHYPVAGGEHNRAVWNVGD
jgi:hypothetical protein